MITSHWCARYCSGAGGIGFPGVQSHRSNEETSSEPIDLKSAITKTLLLKSVSLGIGQVQLSDSISAASSGHRVVCAIL